MVAHGDVIFVSETNFKFIHRIHLPEGSCSKWSVNSKWLTMSTTEKGHILMACYDLCTIMEYTSLGKVVREIKTNDESITCLRHAIQLDDDRFMISHTVNKVTPPMLDRQPWKANQNLRRRTRIRDWTVEFSLLSGK